MSRSVAGALVLYHPEHSVLDNIHSYLGDVEALFVVDNTESGHDPVLVDKIRSLDKVEYIERPDNSGIAVALNICARLAQARGFDWLLTMDQDSRAEPGMIPAMLRFLEAAPASGVGIISPQHVNPLTPAQFPFHEFEEVRVVMTSGNLLNLAAWRAVGPFPEEYFMDYVDLEYCLRLVKNGFKVAVAYQARLLHPLGAISSHKVPLLGTVHTTNHSPLRLYYITRNMLTVFRDYGHDFPDFLAGDRRYFVKRLAKIVFLEKDKCKKLSMIYRGYKDFKDNVTGKLGGGA